MIITFFLPPLPQQKKIAIILSTCDAVIEQTEAAIAKYEAIKQGMMQDLFTRGIDPQTQKLRPPYTEAPHLYKESELGMIPKEWEVKELSSLGEFKNGINKDKNSFGFGTLFVNISDAYPEHLTPSTLGRVNVSTIERETYKLKEGDIIFVRSSVKPSGVGYNTVFVSHNEDVVYSGFMIRFRISSKEIQVPEFYNNFFRYGGFRKRLLCVSTVSANTNVNQENLNRLLTIIPTTEEQVAINILLQSISKKLNSEQEFKMKTTKIKQGLMQDLLTGKIEVIA